MTKLEKLKKTTTRRNVCQLVIELEGLLQEANDGEFDEFTSKKYPKPKAALIEKLENLIKAIKNDEYDN